MTSGEPPVEAGAAPPVIPSAGAGYTPTTPNDVFWFELLKHEDNLFTNRCNFFLLGETMLMAGATTLASAPTLRGLPILFASYCLGLLISFMWLSVNARHILVTEKYLKKQLMASDPRWATIRAARKGGFWNLFRTHVWTGLIMPAAFFCTWCYLLDFVVLVEQ